MATLPSKNGEETRLSLCRFRSFSIALCATRTGDTTRKLHVNRVFTVGCVVDTCWWYALPYIVAYPLLSLRCAVDVFLCVVTRFIVQGFHGCGCLCHCAGCCSCVLLLGV